MRMWFCVARVGTALASGPRADDATASGIIACDSLVTLRRLMVEAPSDRASFSVHLSDFPGCGTVERAQLGAIVHRAMIGGSPDECFGSESSCRWVLR